MSKNDCKKQAGLYGINTGNANRESEAMWGKNCFNSAFPAALACYMRDSGKKAVYINVPPNADGSAPQAANTEIGFDEVFNSTLPNSRLRFHFEEKFQPYAEYDNVGNELDNADLVIKSDGGDWLRPLQIKLTVVPDNSSSENPPAQWAPELVLRPSDTSLCALGMFHAIKAQAGDIKALFDDICYGLTWESFMNDAGKRQTMAERARAFIGTFRQHEKPYLFHPIWKTEGKSPELSPGHALDAFIWSDYAFMLACINKGAGEGSKATRGFRAVARFVRAMHDLSVRGNTRLHDIYRKMDFGRQTDKEIALSSRETAKYMTSPRRTKPLLPREAVAEIILNNGHRQLSPERRFDQTIYFTADMIFSGKK